jgi:V/A-type H+-transporting ATPase subunit A
MGKIVRVTGPVVVAEGMKGTGMYEMVRVGEAGLIGEVIGLRGEQAVIQVYEETTGLRPGEPVASTGKPLSVELGPGLLGSIFDGIQRPLPEIREKTGDFIERGIYPPALPRNRKWEFVPSLKKGAEVSGGEILGTVKETELIEHRVLIPPEVRGKLTELEEGKFTVEEAVGEVKGEGGKVELRLMQVWPVRKPRPYRRKLDPSEPLITGQRVTDVLFPVAKGGTGAIPGGFGTGKTVFLHQTTKWSDANVIVYVGCGERGNEMCDVLTHLPELKDPKTGRPLMERTVLIANTSNMPVAAREASVYTGVTIGEYFRDMGYDVALMADSTSRWAEAMREISGRLEEMPGEEGFPAYLASRLAEFYERAGAVETFGGQKGSLTILGAVSPPGGDFSEPVTQNTLRIVKVFWGLDSSLADRRHFPSVNWLTSYSLYLDQLKEWWNRLGNWSELRGKAMELLQREAELLEIVRLVGPDALPESDRGLLEVARMIREDFLQQSAFDPVDTYCPPRKQLGMLKIILDFYVVASEALKSGVPLSKIKSLPVVGEIAQMKRLPEQEFLEKEKELESLLQKSVQELAK